MTDPSDKLDPMSLLFYMSSFSVMLLLPTTLVLEPGVFGEVGHAAKFDSSMLLSHQKPDLTCQRGLQHAAVVL